MQLRSITVWNARRADIDESEGLGMLLASWFNLPTAGVDYHVRQ
jgi:hypothetical protein